ncbi:MAG: hypothetical protein QM658_04015 [Gordonia sp. (in: high G+C Gram-positive bacteria)]
MPTKPTRQPEAITVTSTPTRSGPVLTVRHAGAAILDDLRPAAALQLAAALILTTAEVTR